MPLTRRALLCATPALLLPGAALAALLPTPSATEGPFYPSAGSVIEEDNDLVGIASARGSSSGGAQVRAQGETLRLDGTVLDRNAAPVAGARVEIWQCDANGVYLHGGSARSGRRDNSFQGFGHAISDAEGRFTFRTIVPVAYPGRTPHIHMKVLRDRRELLTTQFYRQGFPQNAQDFLFRSLSPEEQRRVSMAIGPGTGPDADFAATIQVVLG